MWDSLQSYDHFMNKLRKGKIKKNSSLDQDWFLDINTCIHKCTNILEHGQRSTPLKTSQLLQIYAHT